MRKMWLVAKTTYQQRITSRTFLLLTIGLPLLMVVAGLVPVLSELRGELPMVGFVDRTGQMAVMESVDAEGETLELVHYTDLEVARAGFEAGEVGGVLVLPKDYFEGEAPVYYGENSPNAKLESALQRAIRAGMLSGAPDWQVDRLESPANFTFIARRSGQRVAEGPPVIVRVGTPVFLALVFVLTIFTGANQMGSVMVLEKDQRAMEMVVTSISPIELVTGKVLGMTLLSLTQVAVWIASAATAILLFFGDDLVGQAISIPWQSLLWAGALCIPGYFLFALVGAGLGVIAGDMEQARQLAGMLGFIGMGPMYFMGVIINAIDGPLAVGLTLFPFTAPTISLFRLALTDVPFWQLAASLAILLATLTASIWFVARVFRATMLLYGQKLTPRQVVRALVESGAVNGRSREVKRK